MSDESTNPAPVEQPAPQADPAPAPASWFEALPEDLRTHESIAKTKGDAEVLARAYLGAQKLIGKDPSKLVEIPTVDEDGTATRAILGRLGLPQTVEEYQLPAKEGVPEPLALDKPLGKEFIAKAHEAGILPKQAQAIYDWFAETMGGTLAKTAEAREAAKQEGIVALQKEWGEGFKARAAAADFAVQELGGDELFDVLEQSGLNTNPVVLKALAKIGVSLSANPLPPGAVSETRFGDTRTPEELRAEARALSARAVTERDRNKSRELAEAAQKLYARAG